MKQSIDYGEILFIGKCNCNCYYCLSNEMHKLKQNALKHSSSHFLDWKNFYTFLDKLKSNNVKKIYLSSTITDPLLYSYIDELIEFLHLNGFTVGIRTNGYMAIDKMNTVLKLDDEISFSINSLSTDINYNICNVKNIPDWDTIFSLFSKYNKKCRVSIVVNHFNYKEVNSILKKLSQYDAIDYIQLRKIYKYNDCNINIDDENAFKCTKQYILNVGKYIGNFYESKIFKIYNKKVSLWEDVFQKESVKTYNYFTDGVLSDDNLLIRIYEENNNIE